jgi:hypothetical protein
MKKNIFIIIFFLFASSAYAASLNLVISSATIDQNSFLPVNVIFNPDNQLINALSGEIVFPTDKLKVQGIYDGDSVINLWVQKPQEFPNGIITFSGIIPGGFGGILNPTPNNNQSPGKIFTIIFKTLQAGPADINFQNSKALLNDGKGTPAELNINPLEIIISSSTQTEAPLSSVIANDHNPPDPFKIILSRDKNIFSGKWFIIFHTQDKESGVAYYNVFSSPYAVQNISDSQWRQATSPYLLRDQTLSSYVYVRAVDYNGNSRLSVLEPINPINPIILPIDLIYILAIIIVVMAIILWIIKKKKNI